MAHQDVESLRKQKAFAWAKYYNQRASEADRVIHIVQMVAPIAPRNEYGEIEIPKELPPFFTREFMEMAVALNKEYTCPVCFENVTKETIHIPFCGHILCKGCYERLEENKPIREKVKCPTCRKSI